MKIRSPRSLRGIAALAATALTAAAVLTGCSTGGGGSASGGPSITVWSWRSQDSQLWQTVAQKTGVNIKFRSITATSYDSVLKTAMNGGSGPDIFYDRAGSGTMTYGAAGLAAPLDGEVKFDGIDKTSLSAAQYQGKTYGVPFAIQSMGLFYNKDILQKNGLDVPTTWDQLLADMDKLKNSGVTPMEVMGVQQWLLSLSLFTIAASSVSDDWAQQVVDKKTQLTSQPYLDAMKAFQQLEPYFEKNWQAVGSGGNEQETDFALGKTAFIIDGIFDTATINQVNPKLNYGQMLVPSPNGQTPKLEWYVDGNISMNANIKDSQEAAAAKKVIQYTATKDFGDAFSQAAGEISPISGVDIPSKFPLAVQSKKWYDESAIKPAFGLRSPLDTPPVDTSTLKSTASPSTGQAVNTNKGIYTAQQGIMVDLLSGKLTPEQAAQKLQAALKWYYAG